MKRAFAFGLAATLLAATGPISAVTFTVTNTNDAGAGSLRQAILDANASAGADDIVFAIPGPGVHTIVLASLFRRSTRASSSTATRSPGRRRTRFRRTRA